MKYFATTAALVSVIPGIVSLTINTPSSVTACQPQLLSWTDGAPPYYLSILPGGQPSATPLKSFDTQNGMSLTWIVDIAAGTLVTFSVKDSTGTTAYTDEVIIQGGSDNSCMNGGTQTTAVTADPGSGGSSSSAGTSGSSDSANPANPSVAATQDVGTSSSTLSGTAGTTRASGVGAAATTARANASATTPGATQSRAVATAGTTSAARPSSSSTSGAESVFTASGLGFAGFIGLAGALFL